MYDSPCWVALGARFKVGPTELPPRALFPSVIHVLHVSAHAITLITDTYDQNYFARCTTPGGIRAIMPKIYEVFDQCISILSPFHLSPYFNTPSKVARFSRE